MGSGIFAAEKTAAGSRLYIGLNTLATRAARARPGSLSREWDLPDRRRKCEVRKRFRVIGGQHGSAAFNDCLSHI